MVVKKSQLYSSLWQSCDELRGGMDASQYKDYVLVLLFLKYVSDKYAGVPYAPITIPKGSSFKDMVGLKGKSDIGDQINKKIIGPLALANKLSDMPDFNDATKLGTGKEMVDRLTGLIAIFENPALDFSKNRADGDDILGDAYEYLMRHFATESGKSKGQFYTPAEVSRIMAQIIGIKSAKTTNDTTVYDPTCGSGSLLLKVGDAATAKVTLYGQEKDAATSGLARMNMILHHNPTALIVQGNTLANPKFKDGESLKTFDYVVANPPFSDKRWSNGIDPLKDPYERFKHFGVPPGKQGDYAYLLHIVRSLKSNGKGACILPHGVLFRGNAEGDIRRELVRKGYIKGIIGLPMNLFYGTGIAACIIVIDKEHAHARKGIFMIDASKGYMKDGPKNRLRAQDIHKIVDVFNKQVAVEKYARMVPVEEIEKKNDFNLNLPRYIDSQEPEDLQDIEGHLKGGIPTRDIDALSDYWSICPSLQTTLFKKLRPGYLTLAVDKNKIKPAIYDHPEFTTFITSMNCHFKQWRDKLATRLRALKVGIHPKELIGELGEDVLAHYKGKPLLDAYDVYQHLMDYWAATMQDDAYLIATDGWKAETYRVIETKKGKDGKPDKTIDRGWTCDLIPKHLIVARYYAKEQAAIDQLSADLESVSAAIAELEEEEGGDDGGLAELEKVNKANVCARLKDIKNDAEAKEERAILSNWLVLNEKETQIKKRLSAGISEDQLNIRASVRWRFGYTQQLTHKEWTSILAWPGYRVYRHELDEEKKTLKLWVRRKPVHSGFQCGGCGRKLHRVQDVREREIRDLPWSVYRATVVVEVHRLRCPECGVRVEKIEQLPSKAPFSKRFEEIVGEACESAAASQVARRFQLPETTVRAIDLRYLDRWDRRRRKPPLKHMGVDEIYRGKSDKFLAVVSNLETGEPLWFGKDRKKETLDEFFRTELTSGQRRRIEAACVDMWEPFRLSIEQWVPGCSIVYDKFHILQHANDAVNEVRRAEFFRKGPEMRDLIKGKKWLLLSRWKNLAPTQRGVLNRLFEVNRRVFKAYLLKESLERLWDYRYEGAMVNYLGKWIDQLRWQRLPSFQKLAKMLIKHLDGILNYCRTKVRFGVVEAINGNIRMLINRGRGYRNMRYLLLKAKRMAVTNTEYVAFQKTKKAA